MSRTGAEESPRSKEAEPGRQDIITNVLASATAAAVAEATTIPLDTAKVRLQLQSIRQLRQEAGASAASAPKYRGWYALPFLRFTSPAASSASQRRGTTGAAPPRHRRPQVPSRRWQRSCARRAWRRRSRVYPRGCIGSSSSRVCAWVSTTTSSGGSLGTWGTHRWGTRSWPLSSLALVRAYAVRRASGAAY